MERKTDMTDNETINESADFGATLIADYKLACLERVKGFYDTFKALLTDEMIRCAEIIDFMSSFQDFGATEQDRERARKEYSFRSDNCIEIDDNALSSRGDDGTWVMAWVWLQDPADMVALAADFEESLAGGDTWNG
jgi:hypothetical protein